MTRQERARLEHAWATVDDLRSHEDARIRLNAARVTIQILERRNEPMDHDLRRMSDVELATRKRDLLSELESSPATPVAVRVAEGAG